MITRADNQTAGWTPLIFKELDENDIPIYQYILTSYDLSVAGKLTINVKWTDGEDDIAAEAITNGFINFGALNYVPEPTDITQQTVDTINAELTALETAIDGNEADILILEGKAATAEAHIANDDNPHDVTKTQIGLENVDNVKQLPLSYLDTDGTMAAQSDVKVPSQKSRNCKNI